MALFWDDMDAHVEMENFDYLSAGSDFHDLCADAVGDCCWITKDHDMIPLDEMEDSHLRNVYRFLQRQEQDNSDFPFIEAFLSNVKKELDRRATAEWE